MTCTSIMCLGLLVGCGSGGGGDGGASTTPPATTAPMKYYYSDGTLKEEGLVLVGADGKPTAIKHGEWKTYYPASDNSGIHTIKIYANDVWEETKSWMEYNADSSIRDTMEDGVW